MMNIEQIISTAVQLIETVVVGWAWALTAWAVFTSVTSIALLAMTR